MIPDKRSRNPARSVHNDRAITLVLMKLSIITRMRKISDELSKTSKNKTQLISAVIFTNTTRLAPLSTLTFTCSNVKHLQKCLRLNSPLQDRRGKVSTLNTMHQTAGVYR